jgi:hypothetical protein
LLYKADSLDAEDSRKLDSGRMGLPREQLRAVEAERLDFDQYFASLRGRNGSALNLENLWPTSFVNHYGFHHRHFPFLLSTAEARQCFITVYLGQSFLVVPSDVNQRSAYMTWQPHINTGSSNTRLVDKKVIWLARTIRVRRIVLVSNISPSSLSWFSAFA